MFTRNITLNLPAQRSAFPVGNADDLVHLDDHAAVSAAGRRQGRYLFLLDSYEAEALSISPNRD